MHTSALRGLLPLFSVSFWNFCFCEVCLLPYAAALHAIFSSYAAWCGKDQNDFGAGLKQYFMNMPLPVAGIVPGFGSPCNALCRGAKLMKWFEKVGNAAGVGKAFKLLGKVLQGVHLCKCLQVPT